MDFDWNDLAFASKKPLKDLKATFIAAPRAISADYFKTLVKQYLPKGNIILGLAKEGYVWGFEGQPQFKMLAEAEVSNIIKRINSSTTPHKIYTLQYFQRETKYLLEKLDFKKVLFVNGSWKYAFHTLDIFYTLHKRQTPYALIPAFKDENEAKAYDEWFTKAVIRKATTPPNPLSDTEMLAAANKTAELSFDYNFQTGVALGKKRKGGSYSLLATAFNRVVPYQTFAMLNGASRETNFSPPHDLNHYDTVHAEVELLLKAAKEGLSLKGCSVFINLLPCPVCSRMLAETDIEELVYREDHSSGYALRVLELAGKKTRRIV